MIIHKRYLLLAVLLFVLLLSLVVQAGPTNGPLRVCPDNPRYFADADGKAVLLVGSHVWYNLVDMGGEDPPKPFDYNAYLDWMAGYGHNYMRMWAWEMVKWDTQGNSSRYRNETTTFHVQPHPWLRTGPGKALDGKPKFDLTKFDPEYFERLTRRLEAARRRGIYVSVMMFEGWAMQRVEDGWKSHPFHPKNNVNNIDGDANGDGKGLEVHELVVDAVTD
ncbi:MAG: apiosidase-like domain-containing protein, partial [Planctomycetota bacterium]